MPLESRRTEHFVTLFDSRFLPLGLALHESLQKVAANSHLWVICIDDLVEQQLKSLNLPNVSAIPLRRVENTDLLAVKPTRTVGEYCWTLTPFAPQAVFDIVPDAQRVTYVDSDVFFFSDPDTFFQELESSQKHVLITEHAFGPGLDRTGQSGRFCVQFIAFCRSPEGFEVMKWWQDRCIEWCFDRNEDGKFGDQKYLDLWPTLFPDKVHILRQASKTLAPWNVNHFLSQGEGNSHPVLYHFHSFRITGKETARLYSGARIDESADYLYKEYLAAIIRQIRNMQKHGMTHACMPEPRRRFNLLRKLYMRAFRKTRYSRLDI